MGGAAPRSIRVRGAREHNLQGVDLDLPREALVVLCGPSGSGKSSLAFDTLHAEGRRRLVEALDARSRLALGAFRRPRVDAIHGLTPTIGIAARRGSGSRRSTVGTLTEAHHFLRVLFARAGVQHCTGCGRPVRRWSPPVVVARLLDLPEGTRLTLLAPVARGRPGSPRPLLDEIRRQGFARVRVDGETRRLDEPVVVDARIPHDIDVVIDRVRVREGVRGRLADAVETALRAGGGTVLVEAVPPGEAARTLGFSDRLRCLDCGLDFPPLTPARFSFNSPAGMCPTCEGLGVAGAGGRPCPSCRGGRLRADAASVRVGDLDIVGLSALPAAEARLRLRELAAVLAGEQAAVAAEPLAEVDRRLGFLEAVDLGWMPLDRPADTLSAGEARRVRLAAQLGGELSGVTYILDEPTAGLHPRDGGRVLDALRRLRDLGNTVIVVEHDPAVIDAADRVVEFGPGAGRHGGRVVFAGAPAAMREAPESATGPWLSGRRRLAEGPRRPPPDRWLRVLGAAEHNLRGVDVAIPLGRLVAVTGVSGAGKSTLVRDVLSPALHRRLHRARRPAGRHAGIEGLDGLARVVDLDPTGARSPRANPATASGAFTAIRELFAKTREARLRGWGPGRFSFNRPGGRCEACRGEGVRRVEMELMPDVFVPCEVCGGSRYDPETLAVRYKGRTIADVLALSVEEAAALFARHPRPGRVLRTLVEVGLGYLALGQPGPTLSAGEVQRVRLARELARGGAGDTIYLLDEPTAGLHFVDVERLLAALRRLVDAGNTVVAVEHHLGFIAAADHVVDLGPEGGPGGGRVVAEGPPEAVAEAATPTGRALARWLGRG